MITNRPGASLRGRWAVGTLIALTWIALAAVQQTAAKGPAGGLSAELAERLTPAQQKTYLAYHAARDAYERAHRAYWRKVEAKRSARKARRLLGQAFTADD